MLITNVAEEDGVFGKATEASEEALGLVTQKAAAEKRDASLKKLRALYTGKGPTLYKAYRIATIAYDHRRKNHFWVGSDNRNNMKAALWNNINHINRAIFTPRRDATF